MIKLLSKFDFNGSTIYNLNKKMVSKFTKYLAVIVLFAFSSLVASGLNSSMDMGNNNQMSKCLFMVEDPGTCQMSISDHLIKWQGMFFAVLDSSLVLFLITFLTLGLAFSIIKYSLVDPPQLNLHDRLKKENSRLKLFDYLLQAISRGILHSKIYA